MGYPTERGLDGVYFQVERDGRWVNVCFSDMTEYEMDNVIGGRTDEWLRSMCKTLAQSLRWVGDTLDVYLGDEGE